MWVLRKRYLSHVAVGEWSAVGVGLGSAEKHPTGRWGGGGWLVRGVSWPHAREARLSVHKDSAGCVPLCVGAR